MIVVKRFFSSKKISLNWNDQSGQIAVVVFLIMAILLVVGLSLATRTSQQIEEAGQAEDTTRVFNAAESGTEKALSDEGNFVYTPGATATDTIVDLNGAYVDINVSQTDDFSSTVQPGQSVTVYTVTSATPDTVDVRWGDQSDTNCANQASIIVTKYFSEGSAVRAEHEAYNPFNIANCRNNQFASSSTGGTVDGVAYRSRALIQIPADSEFIRIKPLYASAQFKVTGSAVDTQAHIIRSQARDTSGNTSEVRTIEVTRTRPAPPSILDYALYSGGSIVKN